MTKPKIKVRAGDGLMVHFPQTVITAPGRRTLVLEGDAVAEVPLNMRFVRRSLRNGDLVVVQTEGKPEPEAEIDPDPDFDVAEED